MPDKKKSPLKARPLRYPGQSIEEAIQDRFDDMVPYILYSSGFIAITILAWSNYYAKTPPNPVPVTILTAGILVLSAYKIWRVRKDVLRLRMARDGEMAVGQYLDDLRKNEYQIFHDIIGQGFNVDHVLISPNGIYTIETKTLNKPIKGDAVISIKDDQLLANGKPFDRNPLIQARAEARWLQELLQSSTGKKFPVKPVVVFPGWFVDPMKGKTDLWILNPKALPTFIQNAPITLPNEDVYLASYHLSRYIRAKQDEKT
jgi:hypothetical protein